MMITIILLVPMVVVVTVAASPVFPGNSSQCVVDNGSKSAGECTRVGNCRYQIGRMRVGAPVTVCEGGDVCCPKGLTLSEKKCDQWKELLHAPNPDAFDQSRSIKPKCGLGDKLLLMAWGNTAMPFEYPHHAALGYGTDRNRLKFLCGATLISERFLVTAAHCIADKNKGKPSYVLIGDTNLDPSGGDPFWTGKPSSHRKVLRIANHTVHPEYRPPLSYNDIALVELATSLELNRYLLPACVGNPLTSPYKSSQVEGSGWGISDDGSSPTSYSLKSLNNTMLRGNNCNSTYDGSEAAKELRHPEGILKSQLCAAVEDEHGCWGDSGGGLLTREGSCLLYLVGVQSVSGSSTECGVQSPIVYTNVATYQDWIERVVWGGVKKRE